MSKFTEQLMPASFRGVGFYVTSAGIKAGRRTVVHEYPQRDKPYVEDIGRATRQITINAFVVGDDYIKQANTLLEAIEKPGQGTLVHPWLGSMTVTLTAVSELKFDTALGVATVSFTATEAGELSFPTAGADRTGNLLSAADEVEKSAIARFCDSIDLSIVSSYVDAALSGAILDKLGIISSSDLARVFDLADDVASLANKGLSLVRTDPAQFAQTLAGALGLSRWATTVTAWNRVGKQLSNLAGKDDMSSSSKEWNKAQKENRVMSDNVRIGLQNSAAIETLTRQLVIAQMVGVSSFIGTEQDTYSPAGLPDVSESQEDPLTETEISVSNEEIDAVCNSMLETLDAEMLLETDDEMYQAIEAARTAIFEALSERADEKSTLVTVTPPEVTPALVLAYDYHDDASRDQEIAARNGVAREAFCPAQETKVMSE